MSLLYMRECPELKVKIKSLAEEAKIIRKEEKAFKVKRDTYKVNSLHHHRIQVVRPEARATLLAYGFLRGTPYKAMEQTRKSVPRWDKVQSMVQRYAGIPKSSSEYDNLMSQFDQWMKEAA